MALDERVDHGGDALAAMEQFLEEFKRISDADGFMAAVWVIRDRELQLTCCTTNNFPLESRKIASEQLQELNLEEAKLLMAPPPALPVAEGFGDNNDRLSDSFMANPFEGSTPDRVVDLPEQAVPDDDAVPPHWGPEPVDEQQDEDDVEDVGL